MGYSKLSQFQGSLMGAALGLCHKTQASESDVLKVLFKGVEAFIQPQGSVEIMWQNYWQDQCQPILSQHQEDFTLLATLPLILYSHENLFRLRQSLETTIISGSTTEDQPNNVELLAFAGAIAHLFHHPQSLESLIPQILTQVDPETPLAQQLTQINQYWQQGAILNQTLHHSSLPESPLAIALYYFLSTPTAFSVALQRAKNIHPASPIIPALTAALCGAYTGLIGIPIPERMKLHQLSQNPKVNPMQLPLEQYILTQATQFFQTWVGVYSPTAPDTTPPSALIVTAPHLLSH